MSLTYANNYTDTCATALCSYADGCDVAASGLSLTYSKNYTDTCATALCSYADGCDVAASGLSLTYANNYADTVAATASGLSLTYANNYTDTCATALCSYADGCDVAASGLSLTYSQNYTDTCATALCSYADGCDVAASGLSLTYAEDYTDSCFGASINSANNGLHKTGTNVVLGGPLTGNTSLTGAHDLCFTHTNFNVTAAVCVTGALNTSTTATIGGNLTLSTVGVGSASDSVLTVTAGGVVQKVSGAELGEDNNRYAIDVVTGNTTLPTTGYTILVSGATSLTLPSGVNGMAYKIKDACGNALAAPITVVGTIDGDTNASINTDYGALELVYSTALVEWYSLAFIN